MASVEQRFQNAIESYKASRPKGARKLLCQAPFVSLNFDQSGNATACCYSRVAPLGRYPEQSIQEIWNSPESARLRDAVKAQDLRGACHTCRGQIADGNFHQVLARNFDVAQTFGDKAVTLGPQILEFELSNICNFECVMCNGHFSSLIRRNREKLPPLPNPYDERFVELLKPLWKTARWARFLGGEPFLNPLYYKMWRDIAAENPKLQVSITTNVSIYNSKVEEVIKSLKPTIVFSIDSFQRDTYEKIRVNASYDKMISNLGQFLLSTSSAGGQFCLTVCPMTSNWQEIPDLAEWSVRNFAGFYLNTVFKPEHLSLRSLLPDELRKIANFYREYKIQASKKPSEDPRGLIRTLKARSQAQLSDLANQLEQWATEREAELTAANNRSYVPAPESQPESQPELNLTI